MGYSTKFFFVNGRYGGTYNPYLLLIHLLHTDLFFDLEIYVIRSSETSVLMETTRRYISEDNS
jgi:hypothetical protein